MPLFMVDYLMKLPMVTEVADGTLRIRCADRVIYISESGMRSTSHTACPPISEAERHLLL